MKIIKNKEDDINDCQIFFDDETPVPFVRSFNLRCEAGYFPELEINTYAINDDVYCKIQDKHCSINIEGDSLKNYPTKMLFDELKLRGAL